MQLTPVSAIPAKVGKTLSYYQQLAIQQMRARYWDLIPQTDIAPVFVIGCSRAGTTLVYKLLSQVGHWGTLDKETHDFWARLHPVEQRHWSSHAVSAAHASDQDRQTIARHFYSLTGQRDFVDKNNQNSLCVDYLFTLFPRARFVYVKRSPGDNINSLMEGWKRPHKYATWSGNLPAQVAIDGGQFTQWCFFLAEGWRHFLNATLEEVCAFQYCAVNQAILSARNTVPESQWIELEYEGLLAKPHAQLASLFNALGTAFDASLQAACSDVLDTPFDAFSPIRTNKWLESAHAERIRRILPRVATVSKAMGYPTQAVVRGEPSHKGTV